LARPPARGACDRLAGARGAGRRDFSFQWQRG
jgi:hypothetical protein